jgi:hypothetical protein
MTPTHMRVYTIAEKIRLSPIEGVILARSIWPAITVLTTQFSRCTAITFLHDAILQYKSRREVSISSSASRGHHLRGEGNCFPRTKRKKKQRNNTWLPVNKAPVPPPPLTLDASRLLQTLISSYEHTLRERRRNTALWFQIVVGYCPTDVRRFGGVLKRYFKQLSGGGTALA